MTKLEQAARQALGALEVATTPLAKDRQEVLRAITTLREALSGVQATAAQAAMQDDLITIRKPTTRAEMLWLLKLAHLVISDVDKPLKAAVAPAQPAAEPSRFGSPELQAMIIARCVEKDQADSVPAVEREQERIAYWLLGNTTEIRP